MTKSETNKRDKAWKLAIRERDKVCQVCPSSKVNKMLFSHHLIPRQFGEYRWDLMCGMLLCFQHHAMGRFSAHQHPIWFAEWLSANRGDVYDWVCKMIAREGGKLW